MGDGTIVCLKRHRPDLAPSEVEIGQFFSSEPISSDPRNHCVPFLDVVRVPETQNETLIITPFLRPWDNPRLNTYGEAVTFLSQIFEVCPGVLRPVFRRSSMIVTSRRESFSCTNIMSPTGMLSLCRSCPEYLLSSLVTAHRTTL